ncbi:hypothetical protein CLV44_11765 [Marinobacterium halophilum]|uniref:Uncharacterized protein n=1 Tax=Marinobacterium halophilum TaxID=267374 RepID=A0A2P8ESS5_9GAMM|nr:hypothetical protein [Marinobacterium halophilum]PSL12536.1 hypothetical protein CLV44_11765 [Marinobacterium halophilum]
MLATHVLHIRDENAFGTVANELKINFDRIRISVSDIITERVTQEVVQYNHKATEYGTHDTRHYLVQPTDLEKQLNNATQAKSSGRKLVDLEKQIDVALKAFQSNGFFILIDDIQVEELTQEIDIKADTLVSFIKLTPLVGG